MKSLVAVSIHQLTGGLAVFAVYGLIAFLAWYLQLAEYLGLVRL